MKLDIAELAARIAKENKAMVLGIGHFVLACLEVDNEKLIEARIGEEEIKNGYLKEYVRFIYSSENVAPTKEGLTPFVREFLPIIKNIMASDEAKENDLNSLIISELIDNESFESFNDNFGLWIIEHDFDVEEKLNVESLKVSDEFADFPFVINLNQKIAEEQPVIIGRDKEVSDLTSILLKKTKSNAVLVGEAGVGKTAIVEKLAQLINNENIHEALKGSIILELNVSGLVAGTHYRGDFEARMNKFLQKVENNPNVILFIDEFHTFLDAGGSEGSVNASNIIKPALARGKLKVIGATTYDEYRKFVEKDKAFSRRFEKVDVSEPTIEETKIMLNGLKQSFEVFHNVKINKDVIDEILSLCQKYVAGRHFPDKAIDILDTACVAAKINNKTVDINTVIKTVEAKSNVKIIKSNNISYKENIKKVIKGQDEAVDEIEETLNLIDLGLVDTNKPLATLMFTGPTGVGKTELAKQIALNYFGSDKRFIRIDMGEYANEADISKLLGAAPGYIGYDNSSPLIEGVRKQPYSVVLLDEIEKAHQKVTNALLQVLDEGFLTSSTGEKIDFRNTLFIMTSNAGYHETDVKPISLIGKSKVQDKKINEALKDTFTPEFLNRIDKIIYFNELCKDDIKAIAEEYIKNFGKYTLTSSDLDELIREADVEKQGARAVQRVVRAKILPKKIKMAKKTNTII